MTTRSPGSATLPASSAAPADVIPRARLLLRIDGLFEAALGALLIVSALTGFSSTLGLPFPATDPVLIAAGLLLLPLLPLLWAHSHRPQRSLLRALAVGNGVGALFFILWVLIWHSKFHAAGAVLVVAVSGILALLAVFQGGVTRAKP
jgi:hypothetical protein